MKKYYLTLCFVFVINGCNKKTDIPEYFVYPNLTVNQLADSSFIQNVFSIVESGGYFYLDDAENNRVVKLDSNLNLVKSFGRSGQGPGEFSGAYHLQVWKDSIYCFDGGGLRINVFDKNGKYSRCIKQKSGVGQRFAIDSTGNVYFYTRNIKSPIWVIDPNGNKIREFGTWYIESSNAREKMARNSRHLLITKDSLLISVSTSEAIIEISDLNGKIINKIDLSDYPYIKDRIAFATRENNRNTKNRESTYLLFKDVSLYENMLCCVVVDGQKMSNKVFILDISNNNAKVHRVLILKDVQKNNLQSINSICANSGDLVIANYDGSLLKYSLKDVFK